MRRLRQFAQIDVFSPTPYLGNPVAVILDAEDLEDADMQRIARWTNLSETTFVLPPTTREGDYRLRIFTPGGKLPFGPGWAVVRLATACEVLELQPDLSRIPAAMVGAIGGVLGAGIAFWKYHNGVTLGAALGGNGALWVTAEQALNAIIVAVAVSLVSGLVPIFEALRISPAMAFRKVV